MALSSFDAAINQICEEKDLDKTAVIETIEAAVAAAYRKDYGHIHDIIRCRLTEDGQYKFWQIFRVVPETELHEPSQEKTLTQAKKMGFKKAQEGQEIEVELPTKNDFGRIAAQTAKQVILQRLKEAEKEILLHEFQNKLQTIINGSIQQEEGQTVIVSIGKVNALLLPREQIPGENYPIGRRLKVLIIKVEEGGREPRVLISRSHPNFIRALFAEEVPEINSGAVVIKNIARDAGLRTKISVTSDQPELDPIGSCVGQRGNRIQAILSDLGEEKIDIILWDDDEKKYLANALAPAKVEKITLNREGKRAKVLAAEDQMSLAIGKDGQNVRLASYLTGWNIDLETTGKEKSPKSQNSPEIKTRKKLKDSKKTKEKEYKESKKPKKPKKAK